MDSGPTNDSQPIDGELLEFIRNIQSEDAIVRLESVTEIRKRFSSPASPSIAQVINAGSLPVFIRYLEKHDDPKLRLESAKILEICTSDHTKAVVDAGAIPSLVALLGSQNEESLRERGVWALGNIAGDSALFRDRVLQSGALGPLLKCLTTTSKIGML